MACEQSHGHKGRQEEFAALSLVHSVTGRPGKELLGFLLLEE